MLTLRYIPESRSCWIKQYVYFLGFLLQIDEFASWKL